MEYPDLVITDTPPEVPPVVPPLHPPLEAPDSVTPTTPDSNRYAFYLLSHHAKDIMQLFVNIANSIGSS